MTARRKRTAARPLALPLLPPARRSPTLSSAPPVQPAASAAVPPRAGNRPTGGRRRLLGILQAHGPWEARHDAKLDALHTLLTQQYPDRKTLVFSQFADTVRYLEAELRHRGVRQLAGVTGDSPDPNHEAV